MRVDALMPPATDAFAAIRRQTATTAAIEQIKGLVTSRTLRPGQRLPSERTLSEILTVSRPTVREAVAALVAMGVLEAKPGKGTYVTALDSSVLVEPLRFVVDVNQRTMLELFDVRLALEVRAAEAAATKITAEQLAALDRQIERLRTHVDEIEEFVEADIAFHGLIHEAAANELLISLMEAVSTLDRRVRTITSEDRRARESTIPAHERIAEALATGRPEEASAAMHAHLHSCWGTLLPYAESAHVLERGG